MPGDLLQAMQVTLGGVGGRRPAFQPTDLSIDAKQRGNAVAGVDGPNLRLVRGKRAEPQPILAAAS